MSHWLRLPIAASAEAAAIDREIVLVHWLMLMLFLGWGAYFVYSVIRFRRSAHPVSTYESGSGRGALVVGAAVLVAEIVLLVFFSIPAWSARVDAFPSEHTSTVVRVVAEQFSWNIHYPGEDGRFGRTDIRLVTTDNPLGLDRGDSASRDDVTTVNRLNLPVNKPAIVYLSSKDVVHSLALPQMRVKQDAIPGTVQPVWFTPTLVGEWEIVCAQLCGLAHYRMKGFYVVQSEADFQRWIATERSVASVR